jgi:hypothetical protein
MQGRDENFIQKFQSGNIRDYLGGIGVDGRIILKWILKRQSMRIWSKFFGS